jgi:single-strand DNA-binding protein
MNSIVLSGRLVRDPEARNNACRFCLAVQRPFANKGEKITDFVNIVAFSHTATYVTNYCKKGTKVIVKGSLQNREYEAQDGSKRQITEIICDMVEIVSGEFAEPKPATKTVEPVEPTEPEEAPEPDFNPFDD